MRLRSGRGRFIIRVLVDWLGILAPITGAPKANWHGKGKRILIFNWRDQRHEYAGGAEVYIHELAKRLAAEGNLVTFFCGSDGQGAARHETIDGVHIVRRGGFWFVYIWAFFYYMLRFRRRYDLIIDCHNGIPFFTPLFAREPVICIVYHVHQKVFTNQLPKPLAKIACFMEGTLMPRIYSDSQFVTISKSTKDDMQNILGIKSGIELIYSGVELETLKPKLKSKRPLVIFLGRLQKYKSVDVAIKAFQQVHKSIPEAKLIIAGGGDAQKELELLVTQKKMRSYVEFTGKVSDRKKLQLYQKAWLMVNPSFMEGWGITTIEANACGTPVIGSNVPGLRDSIKHEKTGILVPYGDYGAMAKELVSLIKDVERRKVLSDEAIQWAHNFRWEISADHLRALIDQQLSNLEPSRTIRRVIV